MAIRSNLKAIPATTSAPSKEVSISVGGLGVLNLSGVYKAKRAEIMARWNGGQIGVTVAPNTFGSLKGYVVMSKDSKLVGFLNFFAPTEYEEAKEIFSEAHFSEYVNTVDMDSL